MHNKYIYTYISIYTYIGEAGCGIADLIVAEMVAQGSTIERARSKIFLVDSQGLVTTSRSEIAEHKSKYAKSSPILKANATLQDIITDIQPTAIIGVSAQPNTFTPQVHSHTHTHKHIHIVCICITAIISV